MRIMVRWVLEILATYPQQQELFKDFSNLEEEALRQALAFAATAVDGTADSHADLHIDAA